MDRDQWCGPCGSASPCCANAAGVAHDLDESLREAPPLNFEFASQFVPCIVDFAVKRRCFGWADCTQAFNAVCSVLSLNVVCHHGVWSRATACCPMAGKIVAKQRFEGAAAGNTVLQRGWLEGVRRAWVSRTRNARVTPY